MDALTVLAWSALAVVVLMTALWAVSVRLRDAGIIAPFWGLGFAIVGWVAYLASDGDDGRRLLLAALTSVWGVRLFVHLARRNFGKPEDFRYAAMRQRHGDRFALRSLVTVFGLQAALMLIVSLPVQFGGVPDSPALGWIAAAGVLVWFVGFAFESVGDLQLSRFRADPSNRGKVLDRGLWRYTRHPNYFGDFCVWCGLWLIAAEAGWPALTIVGPLLMSVLLMRVSGVGLLEKDIERRRPGYADYVRRTSAFFPRPPRRIPSQSEG